MPQRVKNKQQNVQQGQTNPRQWQTREQETSHELTSSSPSLPSCSLARPATSRSGWLRPHWVRPFCFKVVTVPRASRSSVPITSETLSGFCCKWVSSSPTGHKYLSLRFGPVLSLCLSFLFWVFFVRWFGWVFRCYLHALRFWEFECVCCVPRIRNAFCVLLSTRCFIIGNLKNGYVGLSCLMHACLVFILTYKACVWELLKKVLLFVSVFFWQTLYLLVFLIRMDMASLPLTRFWPRINTLSLTYFMNKLIHFPHELLTTFLLVSDHVDWHLFLCTHTHTHGCFLIYDEIATHESLYNPMNWHFANCNSGLF